MYTCICLQCLTRTSTRNINKQFHHIFNNNVCNDAARGDEAAVVLAVEPHAEAAAPRLIIIIIIIIIIVSLISL